MDIFKGQIEDLDEEKTSLIQRYEQEKKELLGRLERAKEKKQVLEKEVAQYTKEIETLNKQQINLYSEIAT